jgi:hypothetical protein
MRPLAPAPGALLAALLALAALAALHLALEPRRALAQEGDDRLAPIREEVVRLEAEGRFESAIVLLRGVKEESLDPGGQLERAQRLDALLGKQLERYADDRTRAAALEKQGKLAEAAAALAPVERYGNAKQVAEAKAERERLTAAAAAAEAKAGEEAKAKAAAEAKRKSQDLAKDQEEATRAVKRWLDARRQLVCSRCNGAKELPCGACEGTGKIKVIHAASVPGVAPSVTYEDCRKCGADGRTRCPTSACGGCGLNLSKVKAVVYEAFPKEHRAELKKRGLDEKRFLDAVRPMLMEEPAPSEVAACVEAAGGALDPIKTYDSVTVTLREDGTALAQHFVRRKLGQGGKEETRWLKTDAGWFLEPPSADAPPAPGEPAPEREPPPEEKKVDEG